MTTNIDVSEKTKEILRYAGWSENRRILIQDYINLLSSAGYTLNDEVRKFLRNFGDLSLKIDRGNNSQYFSFNPIKAESTIWPEHVKNYEERTGEVLVVVGEIEKGDTSILMSHTGKFYLGSDEALIQIGNNVSECLESLCTDTRAYSKNIE